MTAEEYIKHYSSGQGGFESVSVDIALRAIEYAKQEMKQQLMKDAVEGKIYETQVRSKLKATTIGRISPLDYEVGDKVKLIIIKED